MTGPPPYSPRQGAVDDVGQLTDRLIELGIPLHRPVLVCVGGAGGMSDEHMSALGDVLSGWLLPLLEELGAVVVDGGTDSGIMRVIGRRRVTGGFTLPLVGVAARATVAVPGGSEAGDAPTLEPGHSGVVLVAGQEWGAETPWIADVASVVAGGRPSATLLINGGRIAYLDARLSVGSGRPLIALAGTGRAADGVARAAGHQVEGTATDDPDPAAAAELAGSPLVQVASLAEPGSLVKTVRTILGT